MGRGLSELQRSILRQAIHNREVEGLGPIRYQVTMYATPFGTDREPRDVRLARLRDAGFAVIHDRPAYEDVVLLETTDKVEAEAFVGRAKGAGISASVGRERRRDNG